MAGVLEAIDDGVMILKEDEQKDKQESFSTVEFANSFMQQLFGMGFQDDSQGSVKTAKKLTKKPMFLKTSNQTLYEDMDKPTLQETDSVRDLIIASRQRDTDAQEQAIYLA